MNNNFKKSKLKSLKINKAFTPRSSEVVINFDNSAEVVVSIDNLNKLRKISKLKEIKTIKESFPTISNTLNIKDGDSIRWDLLLGKENTKKYFLNLQKEINFSKKLVTSYYTSDVYKKRTQVYTDLEQVILDGNALEIPTYNHASTTGRTSIVSGHNFLTMSKEKRSRLKHSDQNRVLVEIDLKSCEPTFYLKALGKKIDTDDVYVDISNKINIDIADRVRFKRGILSVMYGARDTTSKNILRCSFKDLERIKKYFEIDNFKKTLSENFDNNNLVYNYYGRPLCYNNSLVNYWIQSSAVDFCSLAFLNLIQSMDLKPCFFVHDSVTVAVKKSRLEEISKIKSVTDKYSGIEIPVEVSIPSR